MQSNEEGDIGDIDVHRQSDHNHIFQIFILKCFAAYFCLLAQHWMFTGFMQIDNL